MARHLKIRTKLLLVLAIPLLALGLVTVLGLITLHTVQINGPRYKELSVAKELTSDVNPPSQYIVEAYALVLEATDTPLQVDVPAKLAQLDQLHAQFEARHKYWGAALPPGPLRTALVVTAYAPANQFFELADSSWKPAVSAGNRQDARLVAVGPLERLYRQHRAAIDNVVQVANAEQASLIKQTTTFIDNQMLLLLIAVAGLGGLSVLVGVLMVRKVSRPLRALTANANEIAERALPGAVAAAQLGQPAAPLPPPVSVDGRDEIAELANAMTAMQTTALDLAVEQARMRRNVAEMFVNLGRRNQSLLSRQLAFITDLEQNERNPDTLENLFRLDHLATRMRRNAESLLVLAGAEPARTWSRPVPIIDVVRSALSETEAYDRADLTSVEEATVRGHAASDLAHLLAELLENATSFSPPTTRVIVAGKKRDEGYVLSIVDQGIGMAASDLAEANRRIAEVARFEEAPSKVLGLFVVGRLAARHGIRVVLMDSPGEGVTAKVTVPTELLDAVGSVASAPASEPVQDTAPVIDRVFDAPPPAHLTEALSAGTELERELRRMVQSLDGAPSAPTTDGSPPPLPHTRDPEALHHRVRGANLPDTGPARTRDDELPPPDPDAVRIRLARLADGRHRAQVGAPAPAPPEQDRSPLATPIVPDNHGDAISTASEQPAAGVDGGVQPSVAAPMTEQPAAPAQASSVEPLATPVATPGGLRRRVRGAHLPDTGPPGETEDAPARDASQVRSALTNFARGVALGRETVSGSEPSEGAE